MESASDSPERLVCDTSFVGHVASRASSPANYEHWSPSELERIEKAVLAISVVTLAEVRFGYLKAGWGERRKAEEDRRLGSFLRVPFDLKIVDEWARLRALCEANGWSMAHNDIWIAATASSRGWPLVTCDKDQERIDDPALEVLYLPV
jgi:tRNA(fMet)-specific endonuclease VapC